ncbi:hypothetical protein [Bacillus sp. AFS017336]|uniref:hypothetical protein n=1 Tax=Bacillus sp. AFS017336 TaxID=2033489 RepID=UPI000BF070E1|nr:hypothetical protein [Bacillus sp. AFS017336]PEL13800.1 hypothetical protein CN601_03555 [Bacillus sp. AFS017336]
MYTFLEVISIIAIPVFIILGIIALLKKNGKAKKNFIISGVAILILIVTAAVDPSLETDKKDKVAKETSTKPTEVKDTQNDEELRTTIGKGVIEALKENDFVKFTEEYKKLGSDKSLVWDKLIYGKQVTWTGVVTKVGTSQMYVYGTTDNSDKKEYYTFVAKYKNPEQFKEVKVGDKITVTGELTSRGDYELNLHWKLYNAVLK